MSFIAAMSVRMKIGEIAQGIADAKRVIHDEQPFVVLREATLAEYIDSVHENGGTLDEWDLSVAKGKYLYEVSTD